MFLTGDIRDLFCRSVQNWRRLMLMLKAGGFARTGLIVSMMFVAGQASAMVLTGTPPTTATVGIAYGFVPTMKYANPCKACFHVSGLPSWLYFNPDNGGVWGRPTATGTWSNIRISVWNGVDGASLPAFNITVNAAPVLKISGSPPTKATATQYYYFKPTVTASPGSYLTYKIANKPAWAVFSSTAGTLAGTPSTANIATYYNVAISVTNGKTTASLPAFAIAVARPVTGSAMVSWTKPTRNTDGTPLTNLAGFHVHYGTSAAGMYNQITIASASSTSASIENLTGGTWYFAMSSYTSAGVEGTTSTPVSKTIR
jgi:hypothetical protein